METSAPHADTAPRRRDTNWTRIRDRLAAIPLRLRVVWVVAVVVLVGGPVAITLARPSSYEASIEVFPVNQAGFRPIGDPVTFVGRLLADPITSDETARFSQLGIDPESVSKRVHLAATPRSVLVTVRADSPDHVRALVDALAIALSNAAGRTVSAQASAQLALVRQRLAGATAPSERQRLEARAATLQRQTLTPPANLVVGNRPPPPPPKGAVDRLLAHLPGPLPPRPNLVWTALAGLLLATLVCGGSYLFYSRAPARRRRG